MAFGLTIDLSVIVLWHASGVWSFFFCCCFGVFFVPVLLVVVF